MKRLAPLLLAATTIALSAAVTQAAPAGFACAQDSAATLIQKGRELLGAGRVDEAQAAFDAAFALDKSARTKTWVARGWIARHKFDEALLAADEMHATNPDDSNYLSGLAFLGMAKAAMAAGGTQYTQSQLDDAYGFLKRATAADAERYRDAFLPFAEAAWYAQALDDARAACAHAIALEMSNVEAHALLGRIEFSAYIAASDEAAKERAWKAALGAFKKVIELHGSATEPHKRSAVADAHVQCGDLHAWKQDLGAASTAYANALGLDPSRVPLDRVHQSLGRDAFATCITEGVTRFKKLYSERQTSFATLAWWNGYSLYENAKWAECEAAFRTAVELWPAYANSWYFVFRARQSQQLYSESIDALHTYMKLSPEGLASALGGEAEFNVGVLDFLVGWCANPEKQPDGVRLSDAAFLCEVLTLVQPNESRHWNNLGLFLRAEGDALRGTRDREPDPQVLHDLWVRSLAAYQKSLDLVPGNPNYLNDTGVMYHYYLQSDFDKALALYEQSARRAEEELARKDLAKDERDVIAIAKRDSNDNIRRLKKYLAKRAAGEDVDPNNVR